MNRDTLRANIFSGKNRKVETATFMGQPVEIRPMTIGETLNIQRQMAEDPINASVRALIMYLYVPGTNEKVFEDADADTLLGLDFSPEIADCLQKITKMLGVDVKTEEKNSEETPTS